jgi:hypothetical protein
MRGELARIGGTETRDESKKRTRTKENVMQREAAEDGSMAEAQTRRGQGDRGLLFTRSKRAMREF